MPCAHLYSLFLHVASKCQHHNAAQKWDHLDTKFYCKAVYLWEGLKAQYYKVEVPIIPIIELTESNLIPWELPPVQRGRPRTTRIEKAPAKRKFHCSLCGETGHYQTNCKTPKREKLLEKLKDVKLPCIIDIS